MSGMQCTEQSRYRGEVVVRCEQRMGHHGNHMVASSSGGFSWTDDDYNCMTLRACRLEAAEASNVQIVVDTLRYLAGFSDADRSEDALLELANEIKDARWQSTCCPMCSEIECDGDCPLRDVPRGWSWP